MMAARPLPRSCLERLVVLLNLAIRDLPGWGTRVHEDAPESPFFGFTPTDAVENAFLEIEIAADPSAHARVEAQGRVGAMWRERRNDPRLHQALAIAGSKDRDALLSAIDDRMGREGE
jgi:predicted acyltransferase